MDLTPLTNVLVEVAAAVLTACAPVVTAFIAAKLHIDNETAMRDSLNTALDNGIGVAAAAAKATGDHSLTSVHLPGGAPFNAMMDYVAANAAGAIKHFSLSDPDLAQKVAGRLAIALHVPVPAVAVAPAVIVPPAEPDEPKAEVPAVIPPAAIAP